MVLLISGARRVQGMMRLTKDKMFRLWKRLLTTAAQLYKKSYFWCSKVDCTSGPVQKMISAIALQVARKQSWGSAEAVKMNIPTLHFSLFFFLSLSNEDKRSGTAIQPVSSLRLC